MKKKNKSKKKEKKTVRFGLQTISATPPAIEISTP